jgi:hypothetical protein
MGVKMLGENVEMSRNEFQPYAPDHKAGYYELEQIKPGVVLCPFCDRLIDATQHKEVKAAYVVIQQWPASWASVPICKCDGVWAIYSPTDEKWAFRYKERNGDLSWQ